MPEFRVVIDGKISREQETALNLAIQQVVLTHLAGFGGDNDEPYGVYLPHRDWWGLILRHLPPALAAEALGDDVKRAGAPGL